VKIKMVTGDALAIAKETAKTLGMGTNILDGATLGDTKTKETAAITKSIEDADGFAQVFPEHKYHIVDVLQKHGHIVGMTGDGVNDAPALKKADCGFAVSGATDAARAAASIVLVAPGLTVIIDALKESRKIFQRMNSYAMYRIAETLRVLLFMTLAIVIFNFYPLTAIMIVMLALLNDAAILSIAYDNVIYRNQPEAWNMRLVLGIATVLGLVGPIAAFGLFFLGDRCFSSRPSATANDDVPYAVGRRAFDDLPDPYARPMVVHSPRLDPVGGGDRDSDRGHTGCGLWRLARDATWLEVCGDGLGLCLRLVPSD
jgi:H+-transporting ATPase